jgi:hypothetical protein
MNRKTKRYAAGGEADDDAKAGVVTKFGKTPGGEDTFERDREVKRGESESESKSESAPKRAAVTKEQLEKSGLSLRDYLNRERGLSRRGGEAPKAEAKAKAETPATKESSGMGPKNTFLTKERMKVEDKSEGSTLDRIKEHLGNEFKKRPRAAAKEDEAPAKIGTQNFRASDSRRPTYEKGRSTEEWSKMLGKKKGGSVKSASARADGIAIRGKTRA